MEKMKTEKQHKKFFRPILTAVLIVLALTVLIVGMTALIKENDVPDPIGDDKETTVDSTDTFEPIILPDDLRITEVGSYTGIYMEDGSDEIVTDVMMLVLENTAEKDLQIAKIRLVYSDFTAEFEVTSLPSGESVVLLEKNRHAVSKEKIQSAKATDIVFFDKALNLQNDRLKVVGNDGTIAVTNITKTDISDNIYLYYKNSAKDMLYGGITYRVCINGGIAAGETAKVLTEHYTPDGSRILWITCGE